MKTGGAVAIFVKTPGRSQVKTRLAAGVGEARALEFFELAQAATRAVVVKAAAECPVPLTPYWAVAEAGAESDARWQNLPCVSQGDGSLGERLAHVYSQLLGRHGFVHLIGADSPQLTVELLLQATGQVAAQDQPFVLGPARDGGFYLFGGTRAIPKEAWLQVPYSEAETAKRLVEAVRAAVNVPVKILPWLADVDTAPDFETLRKELEARRNQLLPEQQRLLEWLSS